MYIHKNQQTDRILISQVLFTRVKEIKQDISITDQEVVIMDIKLENYQKMGQFLLQNQHLLF